MENATAAAETEEALPMDTPLAATQSARWRPNPVVERKLCDLEACLAEALTSRPRRYGGRFPEIKARTDFLRTLIAAERECHGAGRPGHLAEVEERFGALERKFEQWAQSGVAAPTEEEEPDQAASESGSESSAGCSCNDSCSGFEFTGPEVEVASDPKCNPESGDAAEAQMEAAAAIEVAPTTGTTARRRWWRRRAALCGAAGVVAVIALAAGLALEFAAVAGPSVNLVPT